MNTDANTDTSERGVMLPVLLSYALGDAWGYTVEFKGHQEISQLMTEGKANPPTVLTISDDTQMSLYTLMALDALEEQVIVDSAESQESLDELRLAVSEQYLVWLRDPDNYRAPGGTCMRALDNYHAIPEYMKVSGTEGTTNYSLGCGTVMRSPWIGLLDYDDNVISTIAMAQAQTTHGDPKGWIVSALAALITKRLYHKEREWMSASGDEVFRLAKDLLHTVLSSNSIRNEVGSSVLIEATRDVDADLNEFIDSWEQIKDVLEDEAQDINTVFGEGWIADEAFYNALGALATYDANYEQHGERAATFALLKGLRRMVSTNGDSDSIAAIGGAFLGAKLFDPDNNDKEFFSGIHSRLEPRYQNEISDVLDILRST